MTDQSRQEDKFRRGFGGVALGGAITAFFVAPLLKFADPVGLAISGAIGGLGLLAVYNARVIPGVKPWAESLGWVILTLGGFGIVLTLVLAGQTSMAVDRYCRGVEAQVIKANHEGKPVGDLKDVFETLQCRTQNLNELQPPVASSSTASTR